MSKELEIAIARLAEKVDAISKSDSVYRATLCEKIHELKTGQNDFRLWMIKTTEAIYNLPCKARAEASKWSKVVTGLQWGALTILFVIIAKHIGWH